MTTKQELYRAIDELNEDQLQKIMQVVETMQGGIRETTHRLDLARYAGVLQLTEDPLTYQERVRAEWS